jgi:hypothetical protein
MRATCPDHLILLDLICLMGMSTNYEVRHCTTFSILLLLHSSLAQIFSLQACSQTPSVYALHLSMRDEVLLTISMAQEPEGSSPPSKQPATDPCPELVKSNPHPQASLPTIHSDPILPSTPWSSEWALSFRLSHQNLVHFSLLPHACYMPRLPNLTIQNNWQNYGFVYFILYIPGQRVGR